MDPPENAEVEEHDGVPYRDTSDIGHAGCWDCGRWSL